jgi:hypothetical protein
MADTDKTVFWDVTRCGSCMNRCFGGTYRLHYHGEKNRQARNIVSSNQQLIEVLRSSETLVLTEATRSHIPEDGIVNSHRRENLKSYIALTGWAL